MNASRVIREIVRVPMWKYDERGNRLIVDTPPTGFVTQRDLSGGDTCNVVFSKSLVFDRSIPPIVASPDGIYASPYLSVDLNRTMSEFDPKISLVQQGAPPPPDAQIVDSSVYDDDAWGETRLPRETRTYDVYNVSEPLRREESRCMNMPMRVIRNVVANVRFDPSGRSQARSPRPVTDAVATATPSDTAAGIVIRRRTNGRAADKQVSDSDSADSGFENNNNNSVFDVSARADSLTENMNDALESGLASYATVAPATSSKRGESVGSRHLRFEDEYVMDYEDVAVRMSGMEGILMNEQLPQNECLDSGESRHGGLRWEE